jgi:hypothetical protein
MPLIDHDGRLFGRLNLVDALCVLFVIGLVPVAYGSLLLFRPARPRIASVAPTAINQEDRRIANGVEIRSKLKVKGDHLTPMLHAFIDTTPAIGFTFESPTSADVIVGDVPLGTHDLILFDGVQEVARAHRAVAILPAPRAAVRIVGVLIALDESAAHRLSPGQRFDVDGVPAAELLQLGDVVAEQRQIAMTGGHVEAASTGSWQRPVLARVFCQPDPDASICRVDATPLAAASQQIVTLPGTTPALRVRVIDVLPDSAPRMATVRVRVTGQHELADRIRSGDRDIRDGALDDRAATVTAAPQNRSADTFDVLVRLGLDRAGDGWRYRAQGLAPGDPFALTTDRYALSGSVISIVLDEH